MATERATPSQFRRYVKSEKVKKLREAYAGRKWAEGVEKKRLAAMEQKKTVDALNKKLRDVMAEGQQRLVEAKQAYAPAKQLLQELKRLGGIYAKYPETHPYRLKLLEKGAKLNAELEKLNNAYAKVADSVKEKNTAAYEAVKEAEAKKAKDTGTDKGAAALRAKEAMAAKIGRAHV